MVKTYEPIDGYSLTHQLRMSGGLATVALGINNTGQIVGYGFKEQATSASSKPVKIQESET